MDNKDAVNVVTYPATTVIWQYGYVCNVTVMLLVCIILYWGTSVYGPDVRAVTKPSKVRNL